MPSIPSEELFVRVNSAQMDDDQRVEKTYMRVKGAEGSLKKARIDSL